MLESGHITTLSQSIVKTLLYFDLFNYPLNQEEVYSNLQTNHVTRDQVSDELRKLKDARVLFQTNEFFSIHDNNELIQRRMEGNHMAKSFMEIAKRRGSLIFQFPFVRAVMISGSLSKNYADAKTDIDFFIITSPGRLWVARTLLVLFKRIFLMNSHKYFCVNYFVDEKHLEIEEKNLFTATELSTLVPLHGAELYDQLILANAWVTGVLPNARKREANGARDQMGIFKRLSEKILSTSLGSWLEKRFYTLTLQRWRRMYARQLPEHDFEVAFKSRLHVSKNHPDNYQRKVMDRYRTKLEEFALLSTWKWTHD